MKIIIEIPDNAVCAIINYLSITGSGLELGSKSINTDELNKAKVKENNNDRYETVGNLQY